jgi:transposase
MTTFVEELKALRKPRQGFDTRPLKQYKGYTHAPQVMEDRLVGDVQTDLNIKHEKVWHRQAQELMLQGMSTSEIAMALGKSRGHVEDVLRQPWARQRMLERTKQSTVEELREILEAESIPSIKTLASIRDNEAEVGATRVSAADKLLDRFLGKATQPITTSELKVDPTKLSTKEILERLAANGALSPATDAEAESPTELPEVG